MIKTREIYIVINDWYIPKDKHNKKLIPINKRTFCLLPFASNNSFQRYVDKIVIKIPNISAQTSWRNDALKVVTVIFVHNIPQTIAIYLLFCILKISTIKYAHNESQNKVIKPLIQGRLIYFPKKIA